MFFADMDGLKEINDMYGQEAGSHAIKTVGRILASVVRNADLVARWGDDEFVIAFTSLPRRLAAQALSAAHGSAPCRRFVLGAGAPRIVLSA